jgi:hypothetical protein
VRATYVAIADPPAAVPDLTQRNTIT